MGAISVSQYCTCTEGGDQHCRTLCSTNPPNNHDGQDSIRSFECVDSTPGNHTLELVAQVQKMLYCSKTESETLNGYTKSLVYTVDGESYAWEKVCEFHEFSHIRETFPPVHFKFHWN